MGITKEKEKEKDRILGCMDRGMDGGICINGVLQYIRLEDGVLGVR